MTNKYASLIKALRIERGFSQSFVAEKLGLSRQSYMAVERGTRELTLPEAEKLHGLYGISIEDLANAVIPQYEKYKEMILAFLQGSASYRDGKVPKTKLAKLLYLADFAWYYQKLESMSGMQYLRRTYGPVPDPYFRALDELELMKKISTKWKDKRTQEIVDFTHEQLPYKLCAPDEAIPYELITQENPEYVY